MSRFGIIAALPGELKPLIYGSKARGSAVRGSTVRGSAVHAWRTLALRGGRKGDAAWLRRIGQTEWVAIAAGMGRDAVARACKMAEQDGTLDALISVGWAGALSCGVSPGNAYALADVVDGESGEQFSTSLAAGSAARLKLVTIGHVAQAHEKRDLAQHFQAVLVDMEGAAVGRFAQSRGVPFYCFKAVTDAYGEILPDLARYTDGEGKLRMPRLVAELALRPKYWPPMLRIGRNSRAGAEAIANALREFIANAR